MFTFSAISCLVGVEVIICFQQPEPPPGNEVRSRGVAPFCRRKKIVLDQVAPFIGSSLPYHREVPNSDGVGTAEHLVGFPPARRRPILFTRGRMRLRSCRLAAMSTTTTTTTVQMMTDYSERTNPLDYLTMQCQF